MNGTSITRMARLTLITALAATAACASTPEPSGPAASETSSGASPSAVVTSPPSPSPAASLDPRVVAVIPVGPAPTGIAYGFGRVWVSNHHASSVSVIDPETNTVVDEIPIEAQPHAITIGDGSVWVATTKADGTIVRIDPETLELSEIVPGESDIACPLAIAYGYVYASQPGFEPGVAFISKSSETTEKLVAKIDVGDGFACGIVGAKGSIWAAVTEGDKHELWKIEKSSAEVMEKIDLPCGSSMWAQSFAFDSIWTVPMDPGQTMCRVDPETGEILASIDIGVAGVLAANDEGIWVADHSGGGIVRVDPGTNAVDGDPIDVPASDGHMWAQGSEIWYASFNTNEVWRIDP